jgi:hypothetical protein
VFAGFGILGAWSLFALEQRKVAFRIVCGTIFVAGFARIIDISDERNPKITAKLMLEAHDPKNCAELLTTPGGNRQSDYSAHYCSPDKVLDAKLLACSHFGAGIRVFATGGIGGVHPGHDPDVSADLLELARIPGLLVCSGPKSIIDPIATAAKLEELGVAAVGYGVDSLPFFLAREAPVELEHRVDTPMEAATIARAARGLGSMSTVLLCNPISAAHAMDPDEIASAVREAERRAEREGVQGKARTPFLLATLAELTDGRSLEANLALLEDNARVAGLVAATLASS